VQVFKFFKGKIMKIIFILLVFYSCGSTKKYPTVHKNVPWEKKLIIDKNGDPKIFAEKNWVHIKPHKTFNMGNDLKEARIDEKPVRNVRLVQDFYIMKMEVTQDQWIRLNKSNLSKFKTNQDCKDHTIYDKKIEACPSHPVEMVSWEEINRLIKLLNHLSKKYIYKLPSEAEFEFAMAGNNTSSFFWGDEEKKLIEYAWPKNEPKKTSPVGKKKPNAFGLYDMAGNVWEWTRDGYSKFFYEAQVNRVNPEGYEYAAEKSIRGGGWNSSADHLRTSYRGAFPPDRRSSDLGFRLIRIKK